MAKGDFPRNKVIGGKTYWLLHGGVFSKRQNALDQAKFDRRHGERVKVVKHRTKHLWAVYLQ